jgi:hypothetical protein
MKKIRFPSILYKMVTNPDNKEAIGFDITGFFLELRDINILCNNVFPKYFKSTKNIRCFIRQLQNYGFKNISGSRKFLSKEVCVYFNQYFRQNKREMLPLINTANALKKKEEGDLYLEKLKRWLEYNKRKPYVLPSNLPLFDIDEQVWLMRALFED